MSTKAYIEAHKHSQNNKEKLTRGRVCGCFYCLEIFSPSEISRHLADETALCPYCGVDSVIGESSGFPITREFLSGMRKEWF